MKYKKLLENLKLSIKLLEEDTNKNDIYLMNRDINFMINNLDQFEKLLRIDFQEENKRLMKGCKTYGSRNF